MAELAIMDKQLSILIKTVGGPAAGMRDKGTVRLHGANPGCGGQRDRPK
jgi:hypothetical protein